MTWPFPHPDSDHENIWLPLRNRAGIVVAWSVVDAADEHLVSIGRWCLTGDGYAHRRLRKDEDARRRVVLLHRAILGLSHGDRRQADHINGNRLDNRRPNLRVTTHAENHQNRANTGGSSRYRGVRYYKRHDTWQAYVTFRGRQHHVGYFATEEEAAAAASIRRLELFSHTNEERCGVAA